MHWNGKQWSIVSSPPNVDQLSGATALATNNVWAVGYTGPGGGNNTPIIEHWNGTQWSIIASPNVNGTLSAVSAVSANDIWATGYNIFNGVILAEHWDGTQWSIVPTAPITGCLINITGVVAIATNDVWIVGSDFDGCNSRAIALSEHWDGTQWTSVGVPSPGKGPYRQYFFNAIAATASNNVWAVGGTTEPRVGPVPLTERWDGTQWNVIPQTNPGEMEGITTTSAGNFWAVGYNPESQSAPPLAESYC
jgi:hypothetical protein